jgi:hypothetical protein
VNPEAAKHIGMVLPGSLMNRADQIIEKDGPIAAQQNESIKK